MQTTLTRRGVLRTAVLSPLVLTSRKASLAANAPIVPAPAGAGAILNSAHSLWLSCANLRPRQMDYLNHANMAKWLGAYFNNIYLTPAINSHLSQITSYTQIRLGTALGDFMYEAMPAMGYSALTGLNVPRAMFNFHSFAQPTVLQIQTFARSNYWNITSVNHAKALYYMSTLPKLFVRDYAFQNAFYQTELTPPEKRAAIAAACGGVLAGSGAGLIAASGVTLGTLGTASVGAAALFTGGVFLVVVAVGFASYYGWQAIQSLGAQPQPVGGMASPMEAATTFPGEADY